MKFLLLLLVPFNSIPTDYIHTIERNEFGIERTRKTLIFRDADKSIRDWRWLSEKNYPIEVRPGLYMCLWEDTESYPNTLRVIYARHFVKTRTLFDVELEERKILEDWKRKKLSK